MNTNSCSPPEAGRRPRFHSADWGQSPRGDLVIACPERSRTELRAVATLKTANLGFRVRRAARFHVVFKIGAERFSGDPSFTRSRRSMSLTEVRRLDWLKCKVGRRTTRQCELIRYKDL